MSHYNTLFHSVLSQIPRHQFEQLAQTYKSNRYVKRLSAWSQFAALLYAQAGSLQSLRELENSLGAHDDSLYHLGIPARVCRSTLATANSKRDWRLQRDLFYKLLSRCRDLTPKHRFKFKNPLYSLDATTISLCLSVFPWARIKHKKGALKLHLQLDHNGDIPAFMIVTKGDMNDVTAAKRYFTPMRDSIYCFDRGYMDSTWFATIHNAGAFFVTRLRKTTKYHFVGQHAGFKPTARLLSDDIIALTGAQSRGHYPRWLRLIRYYDAPSDRVFEFITNHLALPAATVADIYKSRWQIEAFFKWVKQNLKIKTFLGTTENAVLTQIWTAMCYYLLLTYIKYQTKYGHSLYYLHRLIKCSLLEKLTLIDLLRLRQRGKALPRDGPQQLVFNF